MSPTKIHGSRPGKKPLRCVQLAIWVLLCTSCTFGSDCSYLLYFPSAAEYYLPLDILLRVIGAVRLGVQIAPRATLDSAA